VVEVCSCVSIDAMLIRDDGKLLAAIKALTCTLLDRQQFLEHVGVAVNGGRHVRVIKKVFNITLFGVSTGGTDIATLRLVAEALLNN
jgi:hypothetical protein